MRNPLLLGFLFIGAAVAAALSTGCYALSGDCTQFDCGTGGAGGTASTSGGGGTGAGTPAECIPKDASGPVADGCGVFVATSGDDGNLGTKESPVQTLGAAIAKAKDGQTRVYACAETFTEPLTIDSDVTIFGALDCTNNWVYSAATRTTLTAAADAVPLHLNEAIRLKMEDVDVVAVDAAMPGGSSIAVIAESMAELGLARGDVRAGVGVAGSPGANLPAANSGAPGANGVNACTSTQAVTPDPPVNNCMDIPSAGGKGGTGFDTTGGPGEAGTPIINNNNNGGAGESSTATCKVGTAGEDGTDGDSGAGATGIGAISKTGYEGVPGAGGKPGTPGQGGGGGGGSKGGAGSGKCPLMTISIAGASGGSGGSGGCGGEGGKGGNPGGSSIAIVSLGALFTFDVVTIVTKAGGAGGSGGDGQSGGDSGSGGAGGTVPGTATLLNFGCKGGQGGAGGTGGRGGGGLGGHSIGIAHTGSAPDTTGASIFVGSAGDGGAGDGVNATTKGEKGVAAELQAF